MNMHFASFHPQALLLLLEEVEKTYIFTQKRLDHLLLMTSYLVTIATEPSTVFVKVTRLNMQY